MLPKLPNLAGTILLALLLQIKMNSTPVFLVLCGLVGMTMAAFVPQDVNVSSSPLL